MDAIVQNQIVKKDIANAFCKVNHLLFKMFFD